MLFRSKVPHDEIVVEIGSFIGSSTYALALGCEGRNVKVHAVDTFMGSPGGWTEWAGKQICSKTSDFSDVFKRNLAPFLQIGAVIIHEMSSAGALMIEPPLKPYLLFIDGSHQYEDVLFDITHWWERLKPGGTVALHDSIGGGHPQVKRAVDLFRSKHSEIENFVSEDTISWLKKV